MSFNNIPLEMRKYRQWVLWRLEKKEGSNKPTKPLYVPCFGGGKANVDDPNTWGDFDFAIQAPFTCLEPCDPDLPVTETGYSGLGFVFTEHDPYAGLDLDDTHGNAEAYERQLKIYRTFDSYSELSPSGKGLHIIVKGSLPMGRRRADIELYSSKRYFTMTGNVFNNKPIAERQELLDILFEEMGGPAQTFAVGVDKPQTETDDEVIARALNAANGEKFGRLLAGDWQTLYPSQSEADFAFVDIVAFYTQNREQIARIFRASPLGERDKAKRDDYIAYMVNKSFDRQLPEVDVDGLRIAWEKANTLKGGAAAGPGSTAAAPSTFTTGQPSPSPAALQSAYGDQSHAPLGRVKSFPPGLIGEIAQYIYDQSPRPVYEVALAGAIGLLSGICGRAYNISGTGLNQYILLLAMTGAGKDAIASGTSKLMSAVAQTVPAANDFKGPGELVSSAGLIKWLDKKPCIYSVVGEFGVKLKEMASPHANAHLTGLERVLLQLYSKSGKGNVFDPMAYSDKDKNTTAIASPSLTLLGESVPDRFYEMLDDAMIASGLLPRFMVFEYTGDRQYFRKDAEKVLPPLGTIQSLADLTAHCLSLAHGGNICNIPLEVNADVLFDEFDKWTTDQINLAKSENLRQLWNRAHLKALKLSGVLAVSVNRFNPVVTYEQAQWAISLVVGQINSMIEKFENNEVGDVSGNEAKQINEVIKAIATTVSNPFERFSKYGDSPEMHADGVVSHSHISRKLMSMACFRLDKFGSTSAIKRAVAALLESDELREMPVMQMQAKYGRRCKAYVVANPDRFAKAANKEADKNKS